MTDDRSLERAARTWLEEGPNYAPDQAVEAALARIETTNQERGPLVPWRLPPMSPFMRYTTAAVLAAVAIGGAIYVLGREGGIGNEPNSSPPASVEQSPTLTPTPAATPIDTSEWEQYTSSIYGSVISHPADWSVRPARRAWDFDADAASFVNIGQDGFVAADNSIYIASWTVPVEAGTTLQTWVQTYCEVNTEPCDNLDDRIEPAFHEHERHPGIFIGFLDDTQTFFTSWQRGETLDELWTEPAPAEGGEIYIVAAWRPPDQYNARALVEAFALTLCATCAEPQPSP